MDISYNWLKRYIDFKQDPHQLAALLTQTGLECDTVEEVESVRGGLRDVVIGKVLTCIDHPDSDHLHITTVDLGGPEPEQIVCGAPNVAAGQTVVVATVGTILYDGDKEIKIKKSKIRGVESRGMICAEDELGIGSSHDGIIVIPQDVKPGTPAAEFYNISSDWRLEVELTPNRVDAASHYGVARDIKARQWCEIAQNNDEGAAPLPEISLPDVASFSVDNPNGAATVMVEDKEGCPRYSGVTLRGVKVAPSPEWLQKLLVAAGQRPINNIVDITNFVLLGIGQPLHCFDLDKVAGEQIVVRTCPDGTKFTTLDGVERTLHDSDLMICDAKGPMCIAGVFGGLDSGVTDQTTSVFIESAWFNPTRVRRTARRHGLSTDASFRYERGTDPNITTYAVRLAAILVRELAGGEICGDVVDIYPNPVEKVHIEFSLTYCNNLIGKEIPRELVITILKALEFDVETTDNPDILELHVPTYRVDVTRPCDVVEEILRIYGYNNVEIYTEAHINLSQPGDADASHRMQQLISEQLTGQGFNEILCNSLSAKSYYEDLETMPLNRCVTLLNPLSNDLAVLRQTLLFGGLESIAHNANRKATDLKFYEFGNIYSFDTAVQPSADKPLAAYHEQAALGIWLTGKYLPKSWHTPEIVATIFELKAIVENALLRLGINPANLSVQQGSDEIFAASLIYTTRDGHLVATLGQVRRAVLKKFDIELEVVFAQLNWNRVCKLSTKGHTTYSDIPRTQNVQRDLALLVDKSMKFDQIEQAVKKAERKLLRNVTLFDVYEGKNLPEGKKSYAISITLRDNDKTMTDRQIDAIMSKIVKALEDLGASLR